MSIHSYLRTRLAIQQFLIGAAGGLWSPVLAQHLLGLGFTAFQITLCVACGTIANLLTSVLAGQIADRWMATERFLGLLALAAGGLLIAAWSQSSFAAVGPLLLLMAVFFMPCYPLGTSMAFRHLEDPARQFASVRIWATIGWVVGGLALTGWLRIAGAEKVGDCLLFGGVACLIMGAYSFTLPSTPPARSASGSAVAGAFRMLREPSFAALLAIFFVYQAFAYFHHPYTSIFLPTAGVDPANVSAVLTLGQIAEVGVFFVLPAVYRRLGPGKTMALGVFCWGLRYVLFAAGTPHWLMVAAVALHGPGFLFSRLAVTLYADEVCPRDIRASVQTLLSLVVDGAGMFAGALASGMALRAFTVDGVSDWRTLWLIPAAGCGAVVVALLAAFRPRKIA
ncbi:MAG TPA: MFS transporter [Planctomycetota bacterium]